MPAENTQNYLGYTLSTLSCLSGMPVEDVALNAVSVVSAIAGPRAGVAGPGGEWHRPCLNLVRIGGQAASDSQLARLLLEPVRRLQVELRELSSRTSVGAIERARVGDLLPQERIDMERKLVERNAKLSATLGLDDPFGYPSVAGIEGLRPSIGDLPEVESLFEPSFVLDDAKLTSLGRMLCETQGHSALVLDENGNLLKTFVESEARGERKGEDPSLIQLLKGADMFFPSRHEESGPGAIAKADAQIFSLVPQDWWLGAAPGHCNELRRLATVCVFTRTEGGEIYETSVPSMKSGFRSYVKALEKALAARRAGRGLRFEPGDEMLQWLHCFRRKFHQRLDSLGREYAPLIGGLVGLPETLLWGLYALSRDVGEDSSFKVHESVEWLCDITLTRHFELLKLLKDEALKRELEYKGREMCLKLFRKQPCSVRDLVRSYRRQRLALHAPVLQDLIERGYVTERPDKGLQITDRAVIELGLS